MLCVTDQISWHICPESENMLLPCLFIFWNTIYSRPHWELANGIHPAIYLSILEYSICIGLVCVFCQCAVPVRAGGGVLVSTGSLCSSSSSHLATTGMLSAGQVGAHTPTYTHYFTAGLLARNACTHTVYTLTYHWELVHTSDPIHWIFPHLGSVCA